MSDALFDSMLGWLMSSDVHESETTSSLKEVMAALRRASDGATLPPDEIYDDAERLLYAYFNLVRQGVRERFTKQHVGVSWYLTERNGERALISHQDGPGAEWLNECYADAVPLWLLIGLFRRIWRRKPLGDQKADETIAQIDKLDADYVQAQRDANPLRLNFVPHDDGDVA
jgi:hypothetical protein